MKIKILKLDAANKNGRIYATATIQSAIDRLENKAVLGTLGMPSEASVQLSEVSHVVNNLSIEDGYLVGNATVLKTQKGEELKKLLAENKIVFRTAGIGKIDENGKVSEYNIISIGAIDKDTAA